MVVSCRLLQQCSNASYYPFECSKDYQIDGSIKLEDETSSTAETSDTRSDTSYFH